MKVPSISPLLNHPSSHTSIHLCIHLRTHLSFYSSILPSINPPTKKSSICFSIHHSFISNPSYFLLIHPPTQPPYLCIYIHALIVVLLLLHSRLIYHLSIHSSPLIHSFIFQLFINLSNYPLHPPFHLPLHPSSTDF